MKTDGGDDGDDPEEAGLLVDLADGVGRTSETATRLQVVVELGRGGDDTGKEGRSAWYDDCSEKQSNLVFANADCLVSSRMSPKVLWVDGGELVRMRRGRERGTW